MTKTAGLSVMTVISIAATGARTTRVLFDSESSRDEAVRSVQGSTPGVTVTRGVFEEHAAASFDIDIDQVEQILRHAGIRCRMLIDVLNDAVAANAGWDRALAWRNFLASSFGERQLGTGSRALLEEDLADGRPLDELPDEPTRGGWLYRGVSRSPRFIEAGEQWLATVWQPPVNPRGPAGVPPEIPNGPTTGL